MSKTQIFWTVDCADGDPDFFVCMNCLNEVFWRKVPAECPQCQAISSFEPFTLDAIRDWGTEELIAKAQQACTETQFHAQPPIQDQTHSPLTETSSV